MNLMSMANHISTWSWLDAELFDEMGAKPEMTAVIVNGEWCREAAGRLSASTRTTKWKCW